MSDDPETLPYKSAEPDEAAAPPHTFEDLGRKLDAMPQVQSAQRLLEEARAELTKAQAHYAQIRADAAAQMRSVRSGNVGDVVESTLQYVRRHPGQGVIGSVLIGFLLGRILRR
ncbi:MAG: hypothetical protein K1X74_04505 [Pirellulales bacterium]|nr:hypothetical protein [Pirellulales bacterium]